ncbi:MAG: beta-lactamase family protein [Deltaproteobacteria bacterium]|nr:beta-lactamase family protein [Deltaproteobacteria bacterium]
MRARFALLAVAALAVACPFDIEGDPREHAATEDQGAPDDSHGDKPPDPGEPPPDAPVPQEPVVSDACEPYLAQLTTLAREFVDALAADQIPGGVFGVAVGDCRFSYGIGADREGAPIDGATRFQMASVSKLFAALTANSLVEDGLLDKHAPVSSIVAVNDRAPYGDAFTLDQLLAHRAGYPDWFLSDDGSQLDRAPFFAAHANELLWAPPGEVFVYNNQGYTLAGHVLEIAGGASYAQLVQARVLDPLGLADTRLGSTLDATEPHSAAGASGTPSSFALYGSDDPFYRSEFYEPMGGVWSSAEDMVALGKAIIARDPRLLSSASIDDLTRSRGPSSGKGSDYAQGLMVFGDIWTHDGATGGFLTELTMVPSRGVVMAVMVAADWAFPYPFAYGAIDMLAPGLDYGTLPPTTPAAQWAGSYADDVILGRVVIAADGANLTLSFPDVQLGPGVPTTMTAELVGDDTYFGPFFDWGEGELVMQTGSDGTRYAASRNFVARAAP